MRRAAVDVPPLALLLLVALSGCDGGGSAQPRAATSSGSERRMAQARREMGLSEALGRDADPERPDDEVELAFALGPARMPELPTDLDADVPPLRDGLARARAALELARPEPDPTWSADQFRAYVEGDLAAWMRARGEALRTARAALAEPEAGELGEHVVASAAIGLLFARFAQAIATVPLPAAIEARADDRLRIRNELLRTAAALYDRAADAFGACASATARADDPSLGAWQRFCDEEVRRAQEAPRPLE